MVYIDLLLLAVVVVYITDISGIIHTLKTLLGKMLNIEVRNLKPFDCSLCMVWWSLLCYALIIGELNIYTLAYTSLLSALSSRIADIMRLCDEVLTNIINRWRG